MSTLQHREARPHARTPERITAQGTLYTATIAEADQMQVRFELATNRRPAPLRGTAMLRKSGGAWTVVVGTFATVWEIADAHGDERAELEGAIRGAALDFAEGLEAHRLGLDLDAPVPFAVTGGAQ